MRTYRPEPAEPAEPDTDHDTGHDCDDGTVYGAGPEPTITMSAREIADLAGLLDKLDRFLRHDPTLHTLAEFYRSQGEDPSPGFTAAALIDEVGLTALGLRHRAQDADIEGTDQ